MMANLKLLASVTAKANPQCISRIIMISRQELRWAKYQIVNRKHSANAVNFRKPFRGAMWNECCTNKRETLFKIQRSQHQVYENPFVGGDATEH